MNQELLLKLSECVEFGKINLASPYPPNMKGQPGADEYTKEALEAGAQPSEILDELVAAMGKVGQKFTENKIFVPQMLLSAKAMSAAMAHLKPFFASGAVQRKGTFIIGTVFGDLHDIGKNLVAMMVEGAGWEVIDLGIDVKIEKFVEAVQQHPGAALGISALLTTTMVNIQPVIEAVKAASPDTKIIVGGAPLSAEFAASIGADAYGKTPQDDIVWLDTLIA
ncbi:cobalamin-dependent protein [Paludibacter jiangxiensis]|uniref:Methanogenic corrinoid protein MtbC1 n=1 Tax=Paludibacter jiangxiensis TaxID=681398 RepID=A0A161LDG3_9BACT|nr:cobalamin-dependent protein [Paludibacter jiangxiensis]GAT62235.1 methanogenic corrinoid protein MtbC1 [Paludibacter jiangxiensis]